MNSMQLINVINNNKRKPFAAHSLKTKIGNRISPPSVILRNQSCILFIFSISNNNINHTVPVAGLYGFFNILCLEYLCEC